MKNNLKESEPEFKGFIDFDSSFGTATAAAPQSSLQIFLSRVSGPLFWIFFSFMIFIFVCYAAYFLFVMLTPFFPQFFSSLLKTVYSLPAPVVSIISLFVVFHIAVAAFLAFLNFAVSFADFYLSGKSLKTHLISLMSPVAKPFF